MFADSKPSVAPPSPQLFLLFRNCANAKTEHPASFTEGLFKALTQTTGSDLRRLIRPLLAVKQFLVCI